MSIENLIIAHGEKEGTEKVIDLLRKGGCTALIFTPEGTRHIFINIDGEMSLPNTFGALISHAILSDRTPVELQIAAFNWCVKNLNDDAKELFKDLIPQIRADFKERGYAVD